LRLIAQYESPAKPATDFQPCAGVGQAITEAPRGILYHRYETDAPSLVNMPEAEAALQAERVVRNYDPCISCATHFLKLKVEGR
jgi:coenzyme F420-reducing hydrogenase alpha subunit